MQSMGPEWQRVEIYSTFLKIVGELLIEPPLRLSDQVNDLVDYLTLRNTTTEPLLTTYPIVSPIEETTTVEKASIVLIVPETNVTGRGIMWKEKVRHQAVLNTTSFSMACDVHLEPRISLLTHLERSAREFLPVTRMSAVAIASLIGLAPGVQPQTLQRDFGLVNPGNIVSFSVRAIKGEPEAPTRT